MSPPTPLCVAVFGARRRRQGTGAHLARFLVAQGATVPALLATTPATATEAAALFEAATLAHARPYTDVEALLATETLDAVVIAGPPDTHAAHLRLALEAGLHALCEKPLTWGAPDAVREGEAIAHAFLERGLHLVVNAQWPFTLPAYRSLFPEVLERAPRRFLMRLSPGTRGPAMLVDALPHPLSLLAAVAGEGELKAMDVTFEGDEYARVAFDYRAEAGTIHCEVHLAHCAEQPRPAAYGFDGAVVERRVTLPEYGLAFETPTRRIVLPDPMRLVVGSFLRAMTSGPPRTMDRAAVPGLRHLAQLVSAAPPATPRPPTA